MNPFVRIVTFLCLLSPLLASAGDETEQLKKRLQERIGDLKVTEIRPAPVAGMYEVVFGTRVAFVSADGKHLLMGDLIDLDSQRNLTAERRTGLVLRAIEAVGEKNMVVFAPDKTKRTITVFTDVDCPYCSRLHQEVPALNRAGVKVRYLLFPRAGQGSESYKRSVAVWCAADRNKAIGIAKAGGKLDMKTCASPVDQHLKLGAEVGVEGTPTIVVDDGRMLPGFVPAAQLIPALGIKDDKPQASR